MQRRYSAYRLLSVLTAAGLLVGTAGCPDIPAPNPFPPVPDVGVSTLVGNESGLIVNATIVYTSDGAEVRRTDLIVPLTKAGEEIRVEKTVVDRIIAVATISDKNTGTIPGGFKVGDPIFLRTYTAGTDFNDGDTLSIIIRIELPSPQPNPDCNNNGISDLLEIAVNPALDCNGNGVLDSCDIASGFSQDCNDDGIPNECEQQEPVITQCAAARTISLGEGCRSAVPDLRTELVAKDNCTPVANLVVSQSPEPGAAVTGPSTVEVTFTVKDTDNRSTICKTNLTFADTTPPNISGCPEMLEVNAGPKCYAVVPDVAATLPISDNCTPRESLTVTQTPHAGEPLQLNVSTPVTVTVRDAANNESKCVTQVRMVDRTPPSIKCPGNVAVDCSVSIEPGLESYVGQPYVNDDCDSEPTVTYVDVVVPVDGGDIGDFGPLPRGGKGYYCGYLVTRTWTATDASNNSASCVQQIFQYDDTSPEVTCPASAIVQCDESLDPSNPNLGVATVFDACDPEPTLDYYDTTGIPSFGGVDGGIVSVITRTWYSYDRCGNGSSCDQYITVVDNTPPTLEIPGDATVECGDSTQPAATGYATATDNCTPEPVVRYVDISDFIQNSACTSFAFTRRWSTTDSAGNTVIGDQRISVIDTKPPVIDVCGSDAQVSVGQDCVAVVPDMTYGMSAHDACDVEFAPFISQDPEPGTLIGVGTHVVTFTASDYCGNSSQCTANLTVDGSVSGGVLFVDAHADGANNGSSWPDAYIDLSKALARAACAGVPVQIWVADGNYKPDGGTGDRTKSFEIGDLVSVYGGFAGGELTLEERNPAAHLACLTGELGEPGLSDNSYHVVRISAGSGGLDGFTITSARADGEGLDQSGAGILITGGSPKFKNCLITGNEAWATGGGAYVAGGGATFQNCRFFNNVATLGGGAACAADAALTVINGLFFENSTDNGGALANAGGACQFVNCTIYGNTAYTGHGGGVHTNGGTTTVANCILWANQESEGGLGLTAQIYDAAGASNVTYSCIRDAAPGDDDVPYGGAANHNIDLDPRIDYPISGEFTLQCGSPCIDTGSNPAVPAGVTTDLGGGSRFIDGDFDEVITVDMGAFESPACD